MHSPNRSKDPVTDRTTETPESPAAAGEYSWNRIGTVLKQTLTTWFESDAPSQSAALAFYTLVSMAPILVIVLAISGVAFGTDATRAALEEQAATLLGTEAAGVVVEVLERADRPRVSGWSSLGALLALMFGATAFFSQLQAALNAIWDVEPQSRSLLGGFLRKRLLSLGLVIVVGFLLLVSLVLSAAITAFGDALGRSLQLSPLVFRVANILVFLVLASFLFALIYRVLPDARIAWRNVAVGAVVTSILFSIGKYLIGVYLGDAAAASAYGTAGSLVVLLLWIYYASMLLLLGAGFTRVWSRSHTNRPGDPEPGARAARRAAPEGGTTA